MNNDKNDNNKKNNDKKDKNNSTRTIKIGFFKRFIMSIKDFDKYNIIGAEGIGRAFLYLLQLLLMFSIILSIALTIKSKIVIKEACNYINSEIPNFKIENNEFMIDSENPIIIQNDKYVKIKIILDATNSDDNTDIVKNKYIEAENDYDGNILIFMKKEVIIKSSTGINITENYENLGNEYGITDITKESLINKFEGNKNYETYGNIFFSIFIITFITYIFSTLLDVLALSLIGYIVTKIVHLPLKYSAILSMSISAITLPIILNLIYLVLNVFTGFTVQYFQMMYTLISYIYLITAILLIRAELIKKKHIINETIKIDNKKENNAENSEENSEKGE